MKTQQLPPPNFVGNLHDGQDIMQILHISPRTLQTLRAKGTLPYTRIGYKIYYHKQDIENLLRDAYNGTHWQNLQRPASSRR